MRLLRAVVLALVCVPATAVPARATGGAPPLLIPPVDAAVTRRFKPPASPYGAGHRGIDYAAPTGSLVRASAAGRVVFAGTVARSRAVTIEHGGGLSTTYSILDRIDVARGDVVGQGGWIGTAAASHPGVASGLHFGVKLEGRYVDPETFLGPVDVGRALHLAPLPGEDGRCREPATSAATKSPPNDNVAIAVGGLGTSTAEVVRPPLSEVARSLGYPAGRVYHFSYRGTAGPHAHRPYAAADTSGDLVVAGRRLRHLLELIARRHPGEGVDIVAHSQGGVVARIALELLVESWDPSLPRVEHVVTLATPHRGTPLAAVPAALRRSPGGRAALWALSWAARRGWVPIPPPDAPAVAQLSPDSAVVEALAREDVLYGARVLSLAMPHDVLVPADRAQLSSEPTRIVSPQGAWGHSAILGSAPARALADAFLRDAGSGCPSLWDEVGPAIGRVVGLGHTALGWVAGALGGGAFPPTTGP